VDKVYEKVIHKAVKKALPEKKDEIQYAKP